MSAVRSARLAVFAVAVLALTLSGCGRRAKPEMPSADPKPATSSIAGGIPGAVQDEKPAPSKKPDRPFILDPLI
ncbi:hypothetical protein C8N35_1011503 [Breoghania corrubedonensis]|uniref:Lipoprotein n=1 Tax=Breoghania corrubedonensis TaxID=665038 RepID=A0A2T5VI62_9HYPH|nr:hypothetical protein [Breoghania corrubedonensis]PTW63449.1 hypothetical protein C8N35_1011503 [Breoghania corrubedonensis]